MFFKPILKKAVKIQRNRTIKLDFSLFGHISNHWTYFAKEIKNLKSLFTLNKYFLKYKWHFLGGILFVSLSNLFAVFPAQSVRMAIDMVIANLKIYKLFNGTELSTQIEAETFKTLLYFGIIIIGLALFRGIFMFLMRQTIIVMSRHIEYDLKNSIYQKYQELPSSFYRKNSTGDLMARISDDVGRVRMYVGPAVMYAINLVCTIVLVIWAMLHVNQKLTLMVIIPLPFLSIAIFYVNHLINKKSDAIQQQLSVLNSFVQEAFSGIRILKSFGLEKAFEEAFENESEVYRSKQLDLAKTDAQFFPLMFFLTGLSTIITLFVGGMEVIDGRASTGNIAEFIMYVYLLTWPVTSLGYTSSLIQRAAVSMKRINEFLDIPVLQNTHLHKPATFNHQIEFREVSVKYPGKNEYALYKLNFTIQKGEKIAILGNTGSGKSTLAQLLLGIISPTSGEIYIDGHSLEAIDLTAYRKTIGYVPQDVFLFSDTISNNIAFGVDKTNVNKEKIHEAAKMAEFPEDFDMLNEGFDTVIGERGITLSGGQKQRISIARALIKNPEILVLDDCLSALDTFTESKILQNLKPVLADKTGIIISHRVSSVGNADLVLVLDAGKIVQMGKRTELAHTNGKYAEMIQNQQKK